MPGSLADANDLVIIHDYSPFTNQEYHISLYKIHLLRTTLSQVMIVRHLHHDFGPAVVPPDNDGASFIQRTGR